MLIAQILVELAVANPIVCGIAVALPVLGGLALHYVFIKPLFNPLNAMPGPKPTHWFYGSFKEIMDTKWSEGHFPEPALSWVKHFGGAVHFRHSLGHRILLTDPEALKHVFTTNGDNYPRAPPVRAFLRDITGGDGLLSTEGETHHHQRKMLAPVFSHGKVKEFIDVFAAHSKHLLDHLAPAVDAGTSVDMLDMFTKMSLDIIGVAAFGYKFGSLNNENERVIHAYKMMNQPPDILHFVCAMLIPGFRSWPLPRLIRHRQAKRMLYDAVDDVIAIKLQHPARGTKDLLDLMLDGDHEVSAEQARTHVMTFMLAGHETTSSTLGWVLTMLATHPDVEAIVRAECRQVAAKHGSIGWSSLSDLKYVNALIQETLRLYPAVANLAPRVCLDDDMLPMADGKPYRVPKSSVFDQGTFMTVNVAALHRNPKYWTQPDEFDLDRFVDGSATNAADKALRGGHGNTYFYMPFSTGPKNCVGMRFALAELQVVVANLVLHHSFKLTSDANINPKPDGVTIKPVALTMTIESVA